MRCAMGLLLPEAVLHKGRDVIHHDSREYVGNTSNTNYASHNLSFATKMRTMELTRTDVNWMRVMIENIQVIDTDLLIECSL